MTVNRSVVTKSQAGSSTAGATSTSEGVQSVSSGESEPGMRGDAVRNAAYALYEARNGVGGSEDEDWLQAEAQIAQVASSGV